MKLSFAVKLGVLMMTLVISLVGSLLIYFYHYSQDAMLTDLKQSIGDVTRTSAFIFKEEERNLIAELKTQLYSQLPEDYKQTVATFSKKNVEGYIDVLISEEASSSIHQSFEFQYIVQLLRRIQEGSRERITPLKILSQSNILDKNASRVAWAYLLVKIPDVAEKDAIMFLADSNYEIDNLSTEGNATGNLYKPKAFFVNPFRGEMGSSDEWYTDLFGEVMTAIVPIKNEDGSVIAALGIDYGVSSFQERIENQKTLSWTVFVIAATIAVLITAVVTFWVSVPLAKLKEGAEQLSRQDFNHKINITSRDEFGVLANVMNQVGDSLEKFTGKMEDIVAQRTKELTSANEQVLKLNQMLTQENVSLGADVDNLICLRKNALYSRNQRMSFNRFGLSFFYRPSKSVCGDFWEHLHHNENELAFCFGHVSGYGLDTAMTVLQLQSILSVHSKQEVEECFNRINQFLFEQHSSPNSDLLAKLTHVSLTENQIQLSGYGEVPIFFTSTSASSIVFSGASTPYGMEKSIELTRQSFEFSQSQSLLIYSSGFRNAICRLHNKEDKMIDAPEFMSMTGLQNGTGEELLERLDATDWIEEFKDDISFVLIQSGQS